MDWQKKIISPHKTTLQESDTAHSPSPPLMRSFWAIGFTLGGLGIYHLGLHYLNIDDDFLQANKWNFKTILFVVATIASALIGGALGVRIGGSIDVKSEKLNHSISVLWHYLANGSLIWIFLVIMCFQKIYGQENLMVLVDIIGKWNLSMILIGIASAGCLVIAFILLLTGIINDKYNPRIGPCFLVSLPFTLAMGYAQFYFLSTDSMLWLLISVAFAFLLHPVSVFMISRDKSQRAQLLGK